MFIDLINIMPNIEIQNNICAIIIAAIILVFIRDGWWNCWEISFLIRAQEEQKVLTWGGQRESREPGKLVLISVLLHVTRIYNTPLGHRKVKWTFRSPTHHVHYINSLFIPGFYSQSQLRSLVVWDPASPKNKAESSVKVRRHSRFHFSTQYSEQWVFPVE